MGQAQILSSKLFSVVLLLTCGSHFFGQDLRPPLWYEQTKHALLHAQLRELPLWSTDQSAESFISATLLPISMS